MSLFPIQIFLSKHEIRTPIEAHPISFYQFLNDAEASDWVLDYKSRPQAIQLFIDDEIGLDDTSDESSIGRRIKAIWAPKPVSIYADTGLNAPFMRWITVLRLTHATLLGLITVGLTIGIALRTSDLRTAQSTQADLNAGIAAKNDQIQSIRRDNDIFSNWITLLSTLPLNITSGTLTPEDLSVRAELPLSELKAFETQTRQLQSDYQIMTTVTDVSRHHLTLKFNASPL